MFCAQTHFTIIGFVLIWSYHPPTCATSGHLPTKEGLRVLGAQHQIKNIYSVLDDFWLYIEMPPLNFGLSPLVYVLPEKRITSLK